MKIKKILSGILCLSLLCGSIVSVSAYSYNSNYDVNNDGSVDLTDLSYMAMFLNGYISPTNPERFDINNNYFVSMTDLYELSNYLMF